MRSRITAALLALALTAALLITAARPESRPSLIDTRGPLHPYLHVTAFLVVGWLAAWTTRSAWLRVALCVGVALLGGATEWLEWRMYQNPFEWTDIVLDAMGAVAGIGLGALFVPRERPSGRRSRDLEDA